MKGWVYVITNKAMPDLVKIGFSMKDPEIRAIELNHTGTPHPYCVEYEVLVENPYNTEQTIHRYLFDKREGKEWFRCLPEEAVAAIKTVVGNKAQLENYKRVDRACAETIRQQKIIEGIISKARDAQVAARLASQKAKDSAQKAAESAKQAIIASKKRWGGSANLGNGERYEGEFSWYGGINGYGVSTIPDGTRYEGEYRRGNIDGFGILTLPNGEHYEGENRKGLKNGYGVFTFSNSDRYEGEWRDGYYNGYGIYTWPNGDRYEGKWVDGNRIGYGVYTSHNGGRHEGEWRNGVKNGDGVEFAPDGSIRKVGFWQDGKETD